MGLPIHVWCSIRASYMYGCPIRVWGPMCQMGDPYVYGAEFLKNDISRLTDEQWAIKCWSKSKLFAHESGQFKVLTKYS